MPKYKLTIEYDGRGFCGWQYQDGSPSVQDAVQEAIKHFCGEEVRVNGAGRTDTGVHATGQVAHIILNKEWSPFTVQNAINAHIQPKTVAILSAEQVDDDFDARFSAKERHYRYDICIRRMHLTFQRGLIWRVGFPLDVEAMHQAAQILVGKHDFTTFRASACQAKSPVKTINQIKVEQNEEIISVYVSALSFLHNQVRSIVGCLKEVGAGRWSQNDLKIALEAKDRNCCASIAPPDGLYLIQVDY